jgi:hypothetical protein
VELTFLEQPPATARLNASKINTNMLNFLMKSPCGEDVEKYSHPFLRAHITHLQNKV